MHTKKMLSILTAIGISFILSIVTFAQEPTPTPGPKTPGIRKRQVNQQRRIGQGVHSGELTAGETVRLEKTQKEIQQDKKAAKSDGVVTAGERKEIHKEQNRASRQIYRAKHNNRDRN